MRTRTPRFLQVLLTSLLTALVLGSPPVMEAQERERLGHDAYEIWRTIGNRAISPDGEWVHYTLNYEDADGALVVRHVDSEREHRIERGASPTFTADGAHVVFVIRPGVEAVRAHRGTRNSSGEQPRDSLGILEVASGDIVRVPGVRAHSVPADAAGWIAYHLHPEADEKEGTLVLRSLADGSETRFPEVSSYTLASDAGLLAFVQEPADEEGRTELQAVVPGTEDVQVIMGGTGDFQGLTLQDGGARLAFLHAPEPPSDEDEPEYTLYDWTRAGGEARTLAGTGTAGIPAGWRVSPHGNLRFSDSGERLFFGTAPAPERPEVDPEWTHRLDEEVDVEVWHWQDQELMTVQNVRMNQERRRNYQAVVFLSEGRVLQLADESLPTVSVGGGGDADWAVGVDNGPYRLEGSWESPTPRDLYLVEVRTGERELVAERSRGNASISPEERFMTWYEGADSTWYARELATGEVQNISTAIGHPVYNERHDQPRVAGSYGSAGWTEADERILLYDRFDLWAVDPTGSAAPRVVTGGHGRDRMIRFRVLRLDGDDPVFAADDEILLSAFHEWEKDQGYFRTTLSSGSAPREITLEARRFSAPVKAAEADRLLFTQETFQDFPDLWVSDLDFANRTRISHANPQQDDYRWGSAELVEWTSTDGDRLQGVLMKPEDFDPQREYPMVVYFYERWSDGLHTHYEPVPHRSRIAFPMYTSHDYLVFIPDVVYRVGYPGEGAMNSIVPGVLHLLEQGFVDRDRIALQGHSWGGYQIAFMVTRSQDLFRAAAAGAPVVNMTSAYGQIRWQTGLVRQFQYERTQSRLGGSLWDMPMRYLENSPLFWVDKIETPLLIMHNDNDGHVPWEQGIEFFAALRRLAKPAWMINYRGEPHWPTTFANRRDWNIRMKQFFDHFLKDEPAPRWMVEGIPAVLRGETLGYETLEGVSVVDGGR